MADRRLTFADVKLFERALQVICGVQVYMRESAFMVSRATPAQRALHAEFSGFHGRLEPAVAGWHRALHEPVGRFKPGLPSQYARVCFVESLSGVYTWERDKTVIDTGEAQPWIWSSTIRRVDGVRHGLWQPADDQALRSEGRHVIEAGWRRFVHRPTRLSGLEAVLFPLEEAKRIAAVTLRNFTELEQNGLRWSVEELADIRRTSAQARVRPYTMDDPYREFEP